VIAGDNALAYFGLFIGDEESFKTWTPVVNVIKLFFFVADEETK
jgi:hypothetical protein